MDTTASGKRGRSTQHSNAAIQCCLTCKTLFGLAFRQTTFAGLPWSVLDFSKLSRWQSNLEVQVAYRLCSGGLNLLLDSTGIKFLAEGKWKC